MDNLYLFFDALVFIIGLGMIAKHYSKGLMTPPVLSGLAFILISLPSLLAFLQ